ncbi:hypothetical protein IE53DRAFT_384368 [Violaceomyces palustris]|uniref:Uncharacterized protein n=1 Tax=Violaceomyces palustris TaxID=1673888 RepID=A0ACD0P508_9BASI|nr:hypothetical protein IE53DRAFT_384368 [Violaceomyces palustris]
MAHGIHSTSRPPSSSTSLPAPPSYPMPPSHNQKPNSSQKQKLKHKQQSLAFFKPFDTTTTRPLSSTPAFTLPSSTTSTAGSSRPPPPPPPPRRDDKGKQRELPLLPDQHDPQDSPQPLLLWVDKHAPTTSAHLAVHKKKVQDVANWLSEALDGSHHLQKYRRLLALTGPSGTAKTAVLRALSSDQDLDFQLVEWLNQDPAASSSHVNQDSIMDRFRDFVASAARYPTLELARSNHHHHHPNTSKGVAGPTYSKSARTHPTNSRRVILIEDLPNIHHGPTRDAFNSILEGFLSRPLPPPASGSGPCSNVPIVLVISETAPKEDDESWAAEGGASGGSTWSQRRMAILDVRTALDETVRRSHAFAEIRFNPIAPTILSKGLTRIVDLEFPAQASRAGKRGDPFDSGRDPHHSRPSPDIIATLAEDSHGDIRSAINCLQFICGFADPSEGEDGRMQTMRGTKRGVQGEAKKEPTSGTKRRREASARKRMMKMLSLTSRRETSLVLFHALGRVLYNKRIGDPSEDGDGRRKKSSVVASTQSDSDDDGDIGMRRKTSGFTFGDRAGGDDVDWSRLPPHMDHLERRKSKVDLEALWADLPVDPSMFQLYLHQNYPNFCDDIDECAEIMEWMSFTEACVPDREEYRHQSLTSHYKFLTTVSATLLHLPSPILRIGRKLTKSPFWEVGRRSRENERILNQYRLGGLGRPLLGDEEGRGGESRSSGGDGGLTRYPTVLGLARSDRQSLLVETLPLLSKMMPARCGGVDGWIEGLHHLSSFPLSSPTRIDGEGLEEVGIHHVDEQEEEEDPPCQTPSQHESVQQPPNQRPTTGLDEVTLPGEGGAQVKLYLSDDDISDF